MFVRNTISTTEPPDPQTLLQNERLKHQNFPIFEVHNFLEGSVANSNRILRMYSEFEKDPILQSKFSEYDQSTAQERELTALRIDRLTAYRELESIDDFFTRLNLVTVYDPSLGIRISINLGLFINCINGNGTDNQKNYWVQKKEATSLKQIYGCFGMTELGHGSNVAGCETTATFDPQTDQFVINTPHIGATKWWIGGAAHSATHSVVYSRLIVKGVDYGVKTFVVLLRDSNHKLMPGISIGDIGAKMGRSGVDNGWIQFSNVRIPRFFMLQKWCKVDRDGTVTKPPLEQLSYISLLGGRVYMAVDSYRICARFVTIACRYAIGRRQFKAGSKDSEETQLLDYPLHQRRILPYLAVAYVMAVGTSKLHENHKEVVNQLDMAVKNDNKDGIMKGLEETKSLFNDSGSLKATLTWLAAECIDQCRQACGGHGYSAYNGFGKAYDDWVVQCTWEGDNNVLSMSVGKTILNHIKGVTKGKKVEGSMCFLNNTDFANGGVLLKEVEDLSFDNIQKALEALIIKVALNTIERMKSANLSLDDVSYNRVLLSKLRCHHYLLETFSKRLQTEESDASILQPLKLILNVYCFIFIIEEYSALFLENELISPSLKSKVSMKLIPASLSDLRDKAIILSDSFMQPDNLLHSTIGKYNGDIYENYFKVVNQENDPFNTKAPYSGTLEQMLNRGTVDERQRGERSEYARKALEK